MRRAESGPGKTWTGPPRNPDRPALTGGDSRRIIE